MPSQRIILKALVYVISSVFLSLAMTSLCLANGTEYAPTDSTMAEVAKLRTEGHYAEALNLGRALLDSLHTDSRARPWQMVDAELMVRTLQTIMSLPASVQTEMAVAEAASREFAAKQEAGDVDCALDTIEQRIATVECHLGSEHPEVADGLVQLAKCYLQQGQLSTAESLLLEAQDKHSQAFGEIHPTLARDLKELARLQFRKGDFKAAEPLLREALDISRHARGDVHPETAMYLYDLALVLMGQGDHAAAEPLFRKALILHRQLLGEEHPKVAHNLNALGVLLKRKGDLEAAESLYRETLAMRSKFLPADHLDIAWSLSNLAGLLCDKGDYAEAEPVLQQALAMQRRLKGEQTDDLDIALVLHNLAYALHLQEKYAEAEEIYREALAMTQNLLGEDNQHTAGILHSLAIVVMRQERLDEAAAVFETVLTTYRSLLGESHPYVAWALADHAICLQAQGDDTSAEEMLLEATVIFETARLRAGGGFARSMFQTSPYSQLAATRLILGKNELAWPAAERALGRSLADLLMAAGRRSLSRAEHVREDSLKAVLDQLEGQLAALRSAVQTDSSVTASARIQDIRSRLLSAEASWSAFERELTTKYPVTEGQAFPLERVQAVLDRKTALVGWLNVETALTAYSSWGYVIRDTGPVHWVSLAPSRIGVPEMTPIDETDEFRLMLRTASTWPFRVTDLGRITDQARRLGAQWLDPLLPHLAEVEHLVIIPSTFLLGVPVEAFRDDTGSYAGDRYSVSYAPSATVFAWLQEQGRTSTSPSSWNALLVGDPLFQPEHEQVMREEEAELESPRGQAAGSETQPGGRLHAMRGGLEIGSSAETGLTILPRLPWTREEIVRAARNFPEPTILLGLEATERTMSQLAASEDLQRFHCIHLATHALIDDVAPERSALVLSRVDLPDPMAAVLAGDPIYDGLLTMKEIVRQWNLDAELVTLSSCRTALGREAGGEGYIGLVHAFLQAGARSLLVSLWRVEDEATALLMGRFYENLTGAFTEERHGWQGQPIPKAAALQEAKSWLRSYRGPNGRQLFRHPAYWSGFILVGVPH